MLIQVCFYLFLSPLVISLGGGDVDYRFDLSFVFLLAFAAGVFNKGRRSRVSTHWKFEEFPMISSWLKLFLMVLSILYVLVVSVNGLTARRQGSEIMAEIYANMPLSHLLVLRIYEVIFYPVLFLVLVGIRKYRDLLTKMLLLSLCAGFLFLGIFDSRSKMIVPLLFYYALFFGSSANYQPFNKRYVMLVAAGFGGLAALIGLSRVSAYDDLSSYFFEDVLRRIDGLELISSVDSVVGIPFVGTLDFLVFGNFIASIPFLEAASALKEAGLTSSKSYLLQVVLGYSQFDMNNSLVTDLYYFGGYVFLVFGAFFYGYLVRLFDVSASTSELWSRRLIFSFMMSFLINSLRIEQDYFAIILLVFRDFFIIYAISLGVKFHVSRNRIVV